MPHIALPLRIQADFSMSEICYQSGFPAVSLCEKALAGFLDRGRKGPSLTAGGPGNGGLQDYSYYNYYGITTTVYSAQLSVM